LSVTDIQFRRYCYFY